jgi:hypothetical protein
MADLPVVPTGMELFEEWMKHNKQMGLTPLQELEATTNTARGKAFFEDWKKGLTPEEHQIAMGYVQLARDARVSKQARK